MGGGGGGVRSLISPVQIGCGHARNGWGEVRHGWGGARGTLERFLAQGPAGGCKNFLGWDEA